MKVSELMTRDVMTIPPDMSVRDAAKALFEREISGLPVVDENKNVVGMITEKEIIGMALPKFTEQLGDFDVILDEEPFAKKLAEADKIKVKDIMRKEVLCINEDVSVAEVARLMIAKKARRIPVLDKNKKLVGIIARADIVKKIAKETGIV
jgi:predicted transcriptional regulator